MRGWIARKSKTREKIIAGLLANTTVRATSQAVGISEATIYRYLKDADFKQEYERKRREMMADNCHMLQASMNRAVTELVAIIEDDETAPQVRLNAIDMLLRHAYKQTEIVDILERLDALEKLDKGK